MFAWISSSKVLIVIRSDAVERTRFLGQRVAAGDLDRPGLEIAHSDAEPDGHALQLVFGKLPSRTLIVVIVILDRNAGGLQFVDDRARPFR